MEFAITKRKLTKAIATAVDDGRVPSDKNFNFYRYGKEFGVYWPTRRICARINVRNDATIYIGHTMTYENGSPFAVDMAEWAPTR
jgi:hypothetical protein